MISKLVEIEVLEITYPADASVRSPVLIHSRRIFGDDSSDRAHSRNSLHLATTLR